MFKSLLPTVSQVKVAFPSLKDRVALFISFTNLAPFMEQPKILLINTTEGVFVTTNSNEEVYEWILFDMNATEPIETFTSRNFTYKSESFNESIRLRTWSNSCSWLAPVYSSLTFISTSSSSLTSTSDSSSSSLTSTSTSSSNLTSTSDSSSSSSSSTSLNSTSSTSSSSSGLTSTSDLSSSGSSSTSSGLISTSGSSNSTTTDTLSNSSNNTSGSSYASLSSGIL